MAQPRAEIPDAHSLRSGEQGGTPSGRRRPELALAIGGEGLPYASEQTEGPGLVPLTSLGGRDDACAALPGMLGTGWGYLWSEAPPPTARLGCWWNQLLSQRCEGGSQEGGRDAVPFS